MILPKEPGGRMEPMIFVNLPVQDLAVSKAFYAAVGFSFNDQFSDDRTACVVISGTIFVMLLTAPRFAEFCDLPIADSRATAAHLLAVSLPDRDAVDAFTAAGEAAGGRQTRPSQDLGFMYSRAVADPDGHIWEPFWMDTAGTA